MENFKLCFTLAIIWKKNTLQLSFFRTQHEKEREEEHVKKDKWKKENENR